MENRKYELTEETVKFGSRTLHRIKAARDFGKIRKGELGGFIEKEENLSHEYTCWIYNNACVFDDAHVMGDAHVKENAYVFGNAWVCENACIRGNAIVLDNAYVRGYAVIFDNARVRGRAIIEEYADVRDYAEVGVCAHVYGHSTVCESAKVNDGQVYGSAHVGGSATIDGIARVGGNAWIEGGAYIDNYALVTEREHHLTLTPVGEKGDDITFYKTETGEIYARSKYFFRGFLEEYMKKAKECKEKEFELAGELAKICIKL